MRDQEACRSRGSGMSPERTFANCRDPGRLYLPLHQPDRPTTERSDGHKQDRISPSAFIRWTMGGTLTSRSSRGFRTKPWNE
jgi:hypothetical protein